MDNTKITILNFLSGFKSIVILAVFLFLNHHLSGQIPQDVPKASDSEPLDFGDPITLIAFIILPLLFIGLYIFLKNKRKNKL